MGLPVGLVDHSTRGASPARVPWVHDDNRDPIQLRFVGDELAKLSESPAMQAVTLRLSGLNPLANVSEVLKSYRKSGAFGAGNDLLGNAVITMLTETSFLAGQLFQPTLCCLGAAALQAGSPFAVFLADSLNLGAGIGLALAVEGEINDAKVDPEDALNVNLAGFRDVAHDGDVPLVADQHEIDLALLELQQLVLARSADEGDLLSTVEGPNRDGVGAHEAEDALVIGLGGVISESDQPLTLIGGLGSISVGHLGDAPHRYLCGDLEASSCLPIGQFVQRKLTSFARIEALLREPVARGVAPNQGLSQQQLLLPCGSQLNIGDHLHLTSPYRSSMEKSNVD